MSKFFAKLDRYIVDLQSVANTVMCVVTGLLAASVDVVQPFVLGCDTKNPKIVQLSLAAVQRLISQQLLSKVGDLYVCCQQLVLLLL